MTNFQKRILTSLVALPLAIFFVVKGGSFLAFFLFLIFFIGMYELFSVFKKIKSITFLSLIIILSLFSIYYLREHTEHLLYFAIAVTISSDVGGYTFGKIFKWKKFKFISPNKTLSGAIGSFLFSLGSVFLLEFIVNIFIDLDLQILNQPKYYFLAILF